MTTSFWQLLVYAGGMAALWAVPGPVWVALLARALSGGFASAWPLAVGVAIGDLLWPLLAILGMSWVLGQYGGLLEILRWLAAVVFFAMGVMLLRAPSADISANSKLTRPGAWAGFVVGLAAVVGNPKAILFYMGALPGFFALDQLSWGDVVAIILISAFVPMIGNLLLALFLDRARALLSSPTARRRLNVISGGMLIGVSALIPWL